MTKWKPVLVIKCLITEYTPYETLLNLFVVCLWFWARVLEYCNRLSLRSGCGPDLGSRESVDLILNNFQFNFLTFLNTLHFQFYLLKSLFNFQFNFLLNTLHFLFYSFLAYVFFYLSIILFYCMTMFICEALWVCLVYEKCYINKIALPCPA